MRRAAALALLAAPAALGHPLDVAFVEIRVEGAAVRASIDLSVEVAESLAGAGLRDPEAVAARARALAAATLSSGTLEADGAACTLDLARARAAIEAARVRVTADARCPAPVRELRWSFAWLDAATLDFRLIAKVVIEGGERTWVLEPGASTLRASAEMRRGLVGFIAMGFHHIGAAPSEWRDAAGWHLPGGIDHILFLFALILAGGPVLRTLGTVTGFTAGHSLTLALASLGAVQLPSRLVEAAIALSIVYVAIEDLFVREPKRRWIVATAFGLVHGFGFASALNELHLSRAGLVRALVGFNLGVELGQALIVLLLWPVLAMLRRNAWFKRTGVGICALCIAAAGAYWFVQRAILGG